MCKVDIVLYQLHCVRLYHQQQFSGWVNFFFWLRQENTVEKTFDLLRQANHIKRIFSFCYISYNVQLNVDFFL